MGLLTFLGLKPNASVEAQYAPAVMDGRFGSNLFTFGQSSIDRLTALQVPTVSRCRNLIAGVISGIDLQLYSKSTGAKLENPVWLNQPDIRQPRSVTIAFTIDALIFNSVAYWRVNSLYADDGRPSGFEFINNDRVVVKTNQLGTEVDYYQVDGERVPMSGIGSLITFQSLLPGVLQTGGRTIQAALDVQKAACVAAGTPMPTSIIKNNGADLPEAQVQGILAAYKSARQNRSTAYFTSTLELQPIGFSPKDMLYNEASQYLATEIARLMNCPAHMVSADMNNSMTYQNILDGRKEFMAYTLQPYICAVEDRLSMDDITARGNVVKFAVDESFLRADTMARLMLIEKLLALELITREQAQSMEQLAPNGESNVTNI